MGKKTRDEKKDIRINLNLQMNIASEIANRNPRIMALQNKYNERLLRNSRDQDYHREYRKLFNEIYGDVFPRYFSPALRCEEFEKKPFELVLSIDLNYTKDEILHVIDKSITFARGQYIKDHTVKIKRKNVQRWNEYLEVWDLKNDGTPWVKAGDVKLPHYLAAGKKGKQGKPWSYEEIAKHLYPDEQTPIELHKAIERVKKQYSAAVQLICGKKYSHEEIEAQKAMIRGGDENGAITCDTCPDKKNCKVLCPPMLRLASDKEVKQQHKIVRKLDGLDLDQYKSGSSRLPTSNEQFMKLK